MNAEEARYALEATAFSTLQEAQEITNVLEDTLAGARMGAANVSAELIEIFSEIVNNAAEHGVQVSARPAHAHVRFLPHRRSNAFDVVVVDEGPGIRETLTRNPKLDVPGADGEAVLLATQELVSGTADPTRGIGLWMTVTQMRRPGRKLWIHSGTGLLVTYGDAEPEARESEHRQGTVVRLTLPA